MNRKKGIKVTALLLVLCSMAFAGCGKKTLTAEEFAKELHNPAQAENFSSEKEPLTMDEYMDKIEKTGFQPMFQSNKDGAASVASLSQYGQAGFGSYASEDMAKEKYLEGLESVITQYQEIAITQLAGAPIVVNETAEDHDALIIQSKDIYLNFSRVGNTVFSVIVVNDATEWAKKFEEVFEGTGYYIVK